MHLPCVEGTGPARGWPSTTPPRSPAKQSIPGRNTAQSKAPGLQVFAVFRAEPGDTEPQADMILGFQVPAALFFLNLQIQMIQKKNLLLPSYVNKHGNIEG